MTSDKLEKSYADVLGELEEATSRLESLQAEWDEYRSEERLSDREEFRGEMLLAWLLRGGQEGLWNFTWREGGEKGNFRGFVHAFAKRDERFAEHAWLLGEKAVADDLALRKEIDRKKTPIAG